MASAAHPWSPDKRTISGNYKAAAERDQSTQDLQWSVFFNKRANELDALLQSTGGEQHDANKIFCDSYQQCINNLAAGQPRADAAKDIEALVRQEKEIAPWQPATKKKK